MKKCFGLLLALSVSVFARAGEPVDLLAGGNLSAFINAAGGPPSAGWVLENGVLSRTPNKAGYIWSKEKFGDFVLELEFKTEGNSGLFFRTENPQNPVQTGFEMQVDTPRAPDKHSVGAVYDLQAPSVNAGKEGWNAVRLTAQGPNITVELNGQKVVELSTDDWVEAGKNPDGTKNKYKRAIKDYARTGHIGFQDHGANVSYRNIRIRSL